jgi:hypothetical protein
MEGTDDQRAFPVGFHSSMDIDSTVAKAQATRAGRSWAQQTGMKPATGDREQRVNFWSIA